MLGAFSAALSQTTADSLEIRDPMDRPAWGGPNFSSVQVSANTAIIYYTLAADANVDLITFRSHLNAGVGIGFGPESIGTSFSIGSHGPSSSSISVFNAYGRITLGTSRWRVDVTAGRSQVTSTAYGGKHEWVSRLSVYGKLFVVYPYCAFQVFGTLSSASALGGLLWVESVYASASILWNRWNERNSRRMLMGCQRGISSVIIVHPGATAASPESFPGSNQSARALFAQAFDMLSELRRRLPAPQGCSQGCR